MAKKATNGEDAPKSEPAAKRNNKALALRRRGWSYTEIAAELGRAADSTKPVTRDRAWQMVVDGLRAEAAAAVERGEPVADEAATLKILNAKARKRAAAQAGA
jgi:hypothetical protein